VPEVLTNAHRKVTRSFVKILNHLNIKFAVLGTEESCTGDPAKRAGNEFVFQMLALQNIEVMNTVRCKEVLLPPARIALIF
jgi:heterodisulfide reductase subunit D